MKRNTMAFLFAMSVAAFGAGCGDGESKPDARPGDGGGSTPGMDGAVAEAGPKLDVPPAIDAGAPDAPLPVDTGAVDGEAIDTSVLIDAPAIEASAVDSAAAIDAQASMEAGAIDAAVCTMLPSRFDVDTVLPKGCYLAQRSPIIATGVRLTLAPGVTIIFSADTGLTFSANQVLVAAGTVAEPILLTGLSAQRGYWKGVVFDGTLTTDSVLDYVTIEYAGSTRADRDAAAVKLTADSRGVRASITHTTLRESQGWGLYLAGSAMLGAFASNTLTRNTLGPATVSTQVVGVLDAASTYGGNDRDEVVVMDLDLSQAAAWAALDVPYYLTRGVRPVADLIVAPGTTFIMAAEAQVYMAGDAATLIAAGTPGKPIRFTGAQPTRGYWRGLIFDGSNNVRNTLSYVTVEHAGSTTADQDAAAVKLAADSHGVRVNISNCVLRQSGAWGLFVTGSGLIPQFAGNQLTQNVLGPAKVGSTAAHQLLPGSTYTGNDVDRIQVQADYVAETVTWSAIGVPYVLDKTIEAQKVWTLAPGVELLMDKDAGISVAGDDAGFHAVGTATAPITISGLAKTPGAWDAIFFDNTLNGANAIDHCLVEFGGGGSAKGHDGMIMTRSDSHGVGLSVTNSRIENSGVYGLAMSQDWPITQSGNTFAGNVLGNIYIRP